MLQNIIFKKNPLWIIKNVKPIHRSWVVGWIGLRTVVDQLPLQVKMREGVSRESGRHKITTALKDLGFPKDNWLLTLRVWMMQVPLYTNFFSTENNTIVQDPLVWIIDTEELWYQSSNHKLFMDFPPSRGSEPLTSVLFKGQLYFYCLPKFQV